MDHASTQKVMLLDRWKLESSVAYIYNMNNLRQANPEFLRSETFVGQSRCIDRPRQTVNAAKSEQLKTGSMNL